MYIAVFVALRDDMTPLSLFYFAAWNQVGRSLHLGRSAYQSEDLVQGKA
jgi:hypothetical protein